MKAIYVIFVCLFVLQTASISANSGEITGLVIDLESGEKIAGANLTVTGTSLGTASDVEGKYTIRDVKIGIYELKCEFTGYKPITVSDVNVTAEKPAEITFMLSPSKVESEEVIMVDFEKSIKKPEITQYDIDPDFKIKVDASMDPDITIAVDPSVDPEIIIGPLKSGFGAKRKHPVKVRILDLKTGKSEVEKEGKK
jgi:hypothetical protein